VSLLDSVLDLLKAKITSRQAIIEKQCDGSLQITAYQGELRQVISNFLLNSLDALDENGKVTLRASISGAAQGEDGQIRISVADNGQGISAEALPHIFDPFFTTKGSIGNGLGLWVSKQLIEKHGGEVTVHSCTDGPQRGTTVALILPTRMSKRLSPVAVEPEVVVPPRD